MDPPRRTLTADGPAGNMAAQRLSGSQAFSMGLHKAARSGGSHPSSSDYPSKRRSMAPASRSLEPPLSSTRAEGSLFGRTPVASRALSQRSSVYASAGHRASMAPSYGAKVSKDPRPVRNQQYQNECLGNITAYLAQRKVQLPMSPKWQVSPSQRDFQTLFRFLAEELVGSGYPWKKKFEDECIAILRDLHYPVLDTVGKTAMVTPGAAQCWPNLLAMLSWLVDLCNAQVKWQDAETISDLALVSASELGPDHPMLIERLFWEFASNTYMEWFEGAEEFPSAEREHEERFARIAAASVEECDRLERLLGDKAEYLRQLESKDAPLRKAEEANRHFLSDRVKFHHFIDNQRLKASKMQQGNHKAREAITEHAQGIAAARRDLEDTETAVAAQNLSPEEVSRMTLERETLSRQLDELRKKISEVSGLAYDQELRVTRSMDRFDQQVQDYTILGHQIGIMAASSDPRQPRAPSVDYAIEIDLGAEDIDVIRQNGQSMVASIRPALQSYSETFRSQLAALLGDIISLEDQNKRLEQDLESQDDRVQRREDRLTVVTDKAEEEKVKLQKETSAYNHAITALEAEVAGKSTNQGSVLTAQSRLESKRIAFEKLRHKMQQLCDTLVPELMDYVDMSVQTKVHTESSLKSILTFAEGQE